MTPARTAPDEVFRWVADDLVSAGCAQRNRRGSVLGSDGTVRAMTSTGRIVVKLGHDRCHELVAAGTGSPYKGQDNAWVVLDPGLATATVRALVVEALRL